MAWDIDGLRRTAEDDWSILGIASFEEVAPCFLEEIGEGETHHSIIFGKQYCLISPCRSRPLVK
ncbi:hypothetical protein [Belnapia rosea]|uniref:Uncharacterized protein n=1 Tax=Belnapia rosea TaxID=938405 RepID=A0A1G7ENF2_9PROT|nr:hypothetical protein [Belnapia rosea]SDB75084.1 hypothetical protein SAMN02927895_05793 [Belnapia rosea]SDE65213.1 hypothetical protein SAMN04487779_10863 [Belnapia rosea]